ncbi:MAG: glutamate--tRNA ligase family protein, partial [Candidatus Woesearchaeota archaeon]|nr:glutamate--tRNA ligase family protein [Candidatus Woesearchaeota archaeon]
MVVLFVVYAGFKAVPQSAIAIFKNIVCDGFFMDKKVRDIIKKHALLNASKYGKADSSKIISKVIGEMPKLKENINSLKAAISEIVSSINKMKKEDIEKEIRNLGIGEQAEKKEKKGLPELHNAENGVVMRFAPSPSGPLHIGHAYVLALNSEYCRKYKGKLILRIEDTNPANIDPHAYIQIPEDAKWLTNGNIAEIVIQSDRLENYYSYALQMIDKGIAYVCTCSSDDFKQYSLKKEECPCRSNSVDKNFELWKKMFSDFNEGDAVLRFKTDMKHKNPAMRDFPLMRICDEEHPRKGKKYRVWPLMNFAVACDDYDLGVTHVLRGKDHADNAKRQEFIQHAMGWPVPETLFVGRINFEGLNLSCSETRQMI